jgi:hypothetical protein
MSTPYVVSSDLVSAYPAKSLAIAQYIDGFKADLAMVQNAQTGTSYQFALTDFTKLLTLNNAAAVAVTVPLEATVAWPAGTQLRLLNQGAGTVTVAGAVGVTINGSPLTLAQYKGAALIKTGTNTWTFAPFSSGVGAANFSDTATGSYTGYKYKTYTDSGTLTVTQAGLADIVVVAGGGAGGSGAFYGAGGGGGGGVLALSDVYLPVGTLTVTVGSGGAAHSLQGSPSFLGDFVAIGGGLGGAFDSASPLVDYTPGLNGGSGGGGNTQTNGSRNGGAGLLGQGFAGGLGVSSITNGQGSGGGGGAGAVGAAGVTSTGGAGGAGKVTTITNVSQTFGGGGGGCGTTNGAGGSGGGGAGAATTGTPGGLNTGGGGGGGFVASTGGTGGAGGKGIVIVRVAV